MASCPSSQGARLPPHVHLKSSFLRSDRWAALDAGPCPRWASSLRTLAASVTPVQWVVSSLQFSVQLFAALGGNTLQGTERSMTGHWVLPTCKQYIEFFIKNFKSLYLVCYSIASVSWGFFWLHCLWDPSFLTRARTHSPCTGRRSLIHWIAREVRPVSMLHQLEQARGSLPSRQTRNMWPQLGQMPLHGCTARRASLGWSLRPPSQHRTWTPVERCILSLGSLSLSRPHMATPARSQLHVSLPPGTLPALPALALQTLLCPRLSSAEAHSASSCESEPVCRCASCLQQWPCESKDLILFNFSPVSWLCLTAGELASGLKMWKELGQSCFCVLLGPNPPPRAPVPGPLRLSWWTMVWILCWPGGHPQNYPRVVPKLHPP